jgi:hypothetical protein
MGPLSRFRPKTAFLVVVATTCIMTSTFKATAQNWFPTAPVPLSTSSGAVGVQTGALPSIVPYFNDLLNINGILSSQNTPWRPGMRLFYGTATLATLFADLAIQRADETNLPVGDRQLCALAMDKDLVLRTEFDPANGPGMGDLLISSQGGGKAIRLCTTPSSAVGTYLDVERVTVGGNGNVGVDLPRSGKGTSLDQFEIGGGQLPWAQQSGFPLPAPGLTIFGGNADEGRPIPNMPGQNFAQDWRYIGFNSYIDHLDNTGSRFHSITPGMGSSRVSFAPGVGWENNTGMIALQSFLGNQTGNSATNGTDLELTGNQLTFFTGRVNGTDASPYYSVFYARRPDGTTATDLGKFVSHGRMYVGCDNLCGPNALNFMLAVNGAIKCKEVLVDINDWCDYVFDSTYQLMPLPNVASYLIQNHHLPGVPSASEVATSGVNLGTMDATLLKKVEELTLYVIQLSNQNDDLQRKITKLEKR